MYEIIFYEDINGRSPVLEWLNSLDSKKGKKTELTQFHSKMNIIKELGTRAGQDTIKHIIDDIWEVRPGRNRVFLAVMKGKKLLLLHPFRKDTKKCPKDEINKANKEFNDWCKRYDL